MDKVSVDSIEDRLRTLKRGEIIVVALEENVWKVVKYSILQKESMNSLFRTLTDNHKEVDREDAFIDKFLQEYMRVFASHEVLCEGVLRDTVGKDLYIKIRDMRLRWEIDTDLNILKISR